MGALRFVTWRAADRRDTFQFGSPPMRLLFPILALLVLTLNNRTAAAQTSLAPPDPANGSVLAPLMPDRLPAPTPIAPAPVAPAPYPPVSAALPAPTPLPPEAIPSPTPEAGTIIAVPLPPPGAAPPSPPAVAGAPTPLAPPGAPIPLSLPPLSSPPAFAKPGTPAAQPGRAPPTIVAKLPTPTLSGDASPGDFLRAARGALAAGRNGEARSALEMAQTRLLSREVDAGKESIPSKNLAVTQISEAIGALAANDRMACLRYIEFASHTIGSPLD